MTTDTTERGLERLICTALTGNPCEPAKGAISDPQAAYGGNGWIWGSPFEYNREYCVDLTQLTAFLLETSRTWRNPCRSMKTARHSVNFWPGFRGKSPNGAPSTYCVTVSSTGHMTLTSSTAPPRPATKRPKRFLRQTGFPLPASCVLEWALTLFRAVEPCQMIIGQPCTRKEFFHLQIIQDFNTPKRKKDLTTIG